MLTVTFTGTTDWTCPAGVTTLSSVILYGGGGGGGGRVRTIRAGRRRRRRRRVHRRVQRGGHPRERVPLSRSAPAGPPGRREHPTDLTAGTAGTGPAPYSRPITGTSPRMAGPAVLVPTSPAVRCRPVAPGPGRAARVPGVAAAAAAVVAAAGGQPARVVPGTHPAGVPPGRVAREVTTRTRGTAPAAAGAAPRTTAPPAGTAERTAQAAPVVAAAPTRTPGAAVTAAAGWLSSPTCPSPSAAPTPSAGPCPGWCPGGHWSSPTGTATRSPSPPTARSASRR